MFVRIIRGDHANTYECDRVHVHPRPYAQETKKFTITMEAPGDTITCEISKAVPEALDVYLMNRQGATIDVVFRKPADAEAESFTCSGCGERFAGSGDGGVCAMCSEPKDGADDS